MKEWMYIGVGRKYKWTSHASKSGSGSLMCICFMFSLNLKIFLCTLCILIQSMYSYVVYILYLNVATRAQVLQPLQVWQSTNHNHRLSVPSLKSHQDSQCPPPPSHFPRWNKRHPSSHLLWPGTQNYVTCCPLADCGQTFFWKVMWTSCNMETSEIFSLYSP